MYTQYMFNSLIINPAYAGSQESLSLTCLARRQWVGLTGAPTTETFSVHTPIRNQRVALGFLFAHDKIGVTNQYDAKATYAYRLPLGKGKLSLAVQGGISNYDIAYSKLFMGSSGFPDPSFSQDVKVLKPNVGAGAYYYTDRFYLGLSVPQLFAPKIFRETDNSYVLQERHYFISSGVVVDLNRSLKLKPNTLIKIVQGVPVQVDINANLLIKEVLWVGASYRSFESVSTLLELQLTDQLRFGYSYDFSVTSNLRSANVGSHEIMLNYRFTFYKQNVACPRYF